MKSDLLQLLENTERYNLPGSSIVYNAQLVYKLGLYCIENNVNGVSLLLLALLRCLISFTIIYIRRGGCGNSISLRS
uniref:Uncharacterized protein n=1 Tax=Schistosoma mansoni TaxID=6183 RepID=A0A146MG90_SCHMA